MSPSAGRPANRTTGRANNHVPRRDASSPVPPDYGMLLGLGAALALFESEEDVARLTAGAIASALGVPFGAVVLRGQSSPRGRLFGHFGNAILDVDLAQEIESYFLTPTANSNSFSLEWVVEIAVTEDHFPHAARTGLRRLLVSRLGTIHDDFGVIIAGGEGDVQYTASDSLVLEALAGQASVALYRVGLTQRLLRQAKDFTFLNTLSTAVSGSLGLAEFLGLALERMIELTSMDAGSVLLVGEDDQHLTLVAEHNLPPTVKELVQQRPLPDGDASSITVADHCSRGFEELQDNGVASHICIPLSVGPRVVGVLDMTSLKSRSFSKSDIALLGIVGEQLGAAIERARILDKRSKLSERLRVLNELMRIAVSSLETGDLIDRVGGQIRQLVEFDLMAVSLRPTGADYTETYEVVGPGQSGILTRGARLPLRGSPMEQVILTGRPLVRKSLPDDGVYPIESAIATESGFRSLVLLRLVSKERTIGTLGFLSHEVAKYGEQDVEIAQEVADHLAILIDDTLLHEELRELAALQERTRLARGIHDALAQSFIGVIQQLDQADVTVEMDPQAARREVDRARHIARAGLEEARHAILALRPSALEKLSLVDAITRQLDSLGRNGIAVNITTAGTPIPVGPEVEIALYRIVEGAADSIRRHGSATRVELRLEYGRNELTLTIEENGFSLDDLGSMPNGSARTFDAAFERERLQARGGQLMIEVVEGYGSRVMVRVPYVSAVYPEIQAPLAAGSQRKAVAAIRVLVADDHVVFRQGIRKLLEEASDIDVVAEAADGKEALAKARVTHPDILVTDVRMPGMGAIEMTSAFKAEGLATRIIILSPYSQGDVIAEAVRAGAHGYLLKDLSGPELVHAIRAVHAGETVMKAASLSEFARSMDERDSGERLTPRELDVLRLLSSGLRNKEIARELDLAEATVKFHVAHVFEKLDVGGRTEAVKRGLQLGLINPP